MTARIDRAARRTPLVAALVVALIGAVLVALLVVRTVGGASTEVAQQDSRTASGVAGPFLDAYVEDDGRVVRHDQGDDTVSEGQAYAMLVAAAGGRERVFGSVWSWTQEHLRRDDGLLSWHWQDGQVIDPSSAADADLDAARALVVAGDRFERPSWTQDGVALGDAVLTHETVRTPEGLVLVAGQWAADQAPYAFNPSYVSPAAVRVLAAADPGDDRWPLLDRGSRAAVRSATEPGHLPPDWAQLDADGAVHPANGPGGQPVQFGYDAERTLVRQAESCNRQDREWAARTSQVLDDRPTVATYDLGGSPTTQDSSSLAEVARAAGAAAAGRARTARTDLEDARDVQARTPTYYGAAWAALGPIVLDTGTLGGCPPLAGVNS